ncbi:MAG: glycosyltransferase [Blastocatellia bacterium]
MPEVSVIIPTYNSARYLSDAVDSVLAQTFKDFEVLVIDDGSTDDTQSVMSRYASPVRCIRQENRGVSAARNRGIEESRSRYIAFLDADDKWRRDKLDRQLAALANRRDCRACYTAFTIADSELVALEVNRSNRLGRALDDLLLVGNVIGTPSTVMCERSLFRETGNFDPALSQCADWEMWVRLAVISEFVYIDEPLVIYREHSGNMSRSAALLERDSLLVLEKAYELPDLPPWLGARRRVAFARNYMTLAGTYFHAGQYLNFARCAARAVALDFHQIGYLMAFPLRAIRRPRSRDAAQTAVI